MDARSRWPNAARWRWLDAKEAPAPPVRAPRRHLSPEEREARRLARLLRARITYYCQFTLLEPLRVLTSSLGTPSPEPDPPYTPGIRQLRSDDIPPQDPS